MGGEGRPGPLTEPREQRPEGRGWIELPPGQRGCRSGLPPAPLSSGRRRFVRAAFANGGSARRPPRPLLTPRAPSSPPIPAPPPRSRPAALRSGGDGDGGAEEGLVLSRSPRLGCSVRHHGGGGIIPLGGG